MTRLLYIDPEQRCTEALKTLSEKGVSCVSLDEDPRLMLEEMLELMRDADE